MQQSEVVGKIVGKVKTVAGVEENAVDLEAVALSAAEPVDADRHRELSGRGIDEAVRGGQHPTGSDERAAAEGVGVGFGEGADGDYPRPGVGRGGLPADDLSLKP